MFPYLDVMYQIRLLLYHSMFMNNVALVLAIWTILEVLFVKPLH